VVNVAGSGEYGGGSKRSKGILFLQEATTKVTVLDFRGEMAERSESNERGIESEYCAVMK